MLKLVTLIAIVGLALATNTVLNPNDDIGTSFCGQSPVCTSATNGQVKANELFEVCFGHGGCGGGAIYSRFLTNTIPSGSTLTSATATFTCCDSTGATKNCAGNTMYIYSAGANQGEVWSETNVAYCPETTGCTIPKLPATPTSVASATEGTSSIVFSGSSLVSMLQTAVSAGESSTFSVWFANGATHTGTYYCSNNSTHPPTLSLVY